MLWKIVLKGNNPSGRLLAVLYARTGETIDAVRTLLDSPGGMVLQAGLSREDADRLAAELPADKAVQVSVQPDEAVYVPVLMGYRPGSRGRLRIALQKLSRLPTEDVIRFLARIPIALKQDADFASAEAIKKVLEKAGGIVEIKSSQNLVGVYSRGKIQEVSSTVHQVGEQKQRVVKSFSVPTDPTLPPVLIHAEGQTGDGVLQQLPAPFDFQPPPSEQGTVPPVVPDKRIIEDFAKPPHVVRFTVPAAGIPPVVPSDNSFSVPPTHTRKAVLVYLFPVAPDTKVRVQSALCRTLGFSEEKAEKLVQQAPVAVAGFGRKRDALATMTELADNGIPVSLVPGSVYNSEVFKERSLPGWFSGR